MKKSLAVFVILAACTFSPRAFCADPKAELQELVSKVKVKLGAGKPTEQDLAPEFANFETALAGHKGEKTDDVASILFMESMLYAEVDDMPKATAGLERLKVDFPDSAPAKKADTIIAALIKQGEAKKVAQGLVEGAAFPDFSEMDLDGKPLSLANAKGKVVLIDFWATWCGPCVQELPNVQAVYAKYHAKGFDIIGISLDGDKAKLTSFIKEKQMPWPQYFDGKVWENKLSSKYGVMSIPATYLLDKDGKIIGKSLRGEALEPAVVAALAAK